MVSIIRKNISNLRAKISGAMRGSDVYGVLFALLLTVTTSSGALADIAGTLSGAGVTNDASGIARNIVDNTSQFPFLVASLAYLIGIVLGISGILKIKEHVDNPQTSIRVGVIRLLIGGAMFALPLVLAAMQTSISGGGAGSFDNGYFSPVDFFSGLLGNLAGLFGAAAITNDFNAILASIVGSLSAVPALITAAAYMLGVVLGVQGLLKLKDHVENPDQNPVKEGLVRIIIGGAFFAIPTIFTAMASMISDGATTSLVGMAGGVVKSAGLMESVYDAVGCTSQSLGAAASGVTEVVDAVAGTSLSANSTASSSIGGTLCGIIGHAGALPAFLNAIAYLFGLVLGFMALVKLKDHALNPQNAPLSQALSRFAAGGAFFALPVIVEAVRQTVTPFRSDVSGAISLFGKQGGPHDAVTGYSGGSAEACGEATGGMLEQGKEFLDSLTGKGGGSSEGEAVASAGLDGRLFCAVTDILGPLHVVLNFFTLAAGTILIMIGISRLLKSEQDGARGPGGIGTFMTFLTGGMLISFSDMIRLVTVSLFSDEKTATMASLQYTGGLAANEVAHAHMVFSAILKFMIMIGLISFVRGIFIIRGVAEGNNQASMMAGMTHIIGGALAVNLGPLMNAVQITLGITGYGVAFS